MKMVDSSHNIEHFFTAPTRAIQDLGKHTSARDPEAPEAPPYFE